VALDYHQKSAIESVGEPIHISQGHTRAGIKKKWFTQVTGHEKRALSNITYLPSPKVVT